MVRPQPSLAKLLDRTIPLRITDLSDIDLNFFQFDYDLTLAVLLMHPDGTVYHRYGGRDHRGPMQWISTPYFETVLERTFEAHERYSANPKPPKKLPRKTVWDTPFAERHDRAKTQCVHCHHIEPSLQREQQRAGKWSLDDIWIYPSPARVGLELAPDDQTRIVGIGTNSIAKRAGLRRGDRIDRIGEVSIATISDVQAALHRASDDATKIPVEYTRGDTRVRTELEVGAKWKHGTPFTFSWRPSKWEILPAPGFGGKLLSTAAKKRLGLAPDAFAMKITYMVTWGERSYTGRNAGRAGLRNNDVVIALDGKTDFRSQDHFHSWFRLTRKIGTKVKVDVIRGGERKSFQMPVIGEPPGK